VDPDEPARMPRRALTRQLHARGQRRQHARRERARAHPKSPARLHLPVVQPRAADVGARQRRAAARLREDRAGGTAAPGARCARHGGARGPGRPPATATLGRSTAARRHRPGARDRPDPRARGRADGQPRQRLYRRDTADVRPPREGRPHDRGHHPRAACRGAGAPRAHDQRRTHRRRHGRASRAVGPERAMSVAEMLLSALRGIASNKLRSILTLLGVMIGVASVILLLAVGNGSAQQVNNAISNLGTTTLTVRASGGGFGGGATASSGASITRTVADQLAAAELGHVRTVIPEVNTSLTVSSTTVSESSITVLGTTPGYFSVGTNTVASGA